MCIKDNWSNIPPEEIKKMISLQNSWEKNQLFDNPWICLEKNPIKSTTNEISNSTINEITSLVQQLNLDADKDNKKDSKKNNVGIESGFTRDHIMKISSYLLFAARALLEEELGLDKSEEPMENLEPCHNMDYLSNTFITVNSLHF